MKLADILNEELSQDDQNRWASSPLYYTHSPELKKDIKRQQRRDSHKFVNAGSNAYVSKIDTPHDMDRVSRTSSDTDGGTVYLKYVYNHPELSNNPFFPKVLGNNTTGSVVTYQIERLVEAEVLSDNEYLMESLWNLYFTVPYPPKDHYKSRVDQISSVIADVAKKYKLDIVIKNKQLLSAIKVIQSISVQRNGHDKLNDIDIHTDNIMWRMVGTMPQLVITDPLN